MTKKKIIGHENNLPWKIKEELQYFRKITLNKVIVMGSNTFISINKKPLPNRYNVVLTRDPEKFKNFNHDYQDNNIQFVSTIKESLQSAENFYTAQANQNIDIHNKEIMIIGGGEIYKQYLPIANKLYLSIIKNDYFGDVFFPEYDSNLWKLESSEDYAEFVAQIWGLQA